MGCSILFTEYFIGTVCKTFNNNYIHRWKSLFVLAFGQQKDLGSDLRLLEGWTRSIFCFDFDYIAGMEKSLSRF